MNTTYATNYRHNWKKPVTLHITTGPDEPRELTTRITSDVIGAGGRIARGDKVIAKTILEERAGFPPNIADELIEAVSNGVPNVKVVFTGTLKREEGGIFSANYYGHKIERG